MKRPLFYAAFVAIATLTACSMNEIAEMPAPTGEVAIGFAPMASKQTKAIPIDGIELTTGNKALILKAYLTKEQAFDKFMSIPDKWIDGMLIYISPKWSTKFSYYWPSNEKYMLSFFSYYPDVNGADGETPIDFIDPKGYSAGAITYPSFSFTVSNSITKQKDLIVAAQKDLTRKPATGATEPSPVALQYKHLLSQVLFKAQSAEPNNYSIRVSGLKITGAKNNATFAYDGSDMVGKWINLSTTTTDHIYRSTEMATFITGNEPILPDGDAKDAFMLMPQDINKDFLIDVRYSIYSPDGTNTFLKDVWKTVRMEKLERGKKYVYNLILPKDESLKPIEFNVTVSAWEDGQNHDVKFTPYSLIATPADPTTAGIGAWANNAKWIIKHISDFALEYAVPGAVNGHTAGNTYTHTIELSGDVTADVVIDLSTIVHTSVIAGSKIIIDATAITSWTGKIIITAPAGWSGASNLTAAGKITLTKP